MEELLEILEEMKPGMEAAESTDLMGDGILTSFDMVLLISRIAEELDVVIPANEVVPENFRTAKTIWALIERLAGE